MEGQPPLPSEEDGNAVRIFAQDGADVAVVTTSLSAEVEAAAEEAAEQREKSLRAEAFERLIASLAGTSAVALATIGSLGVAGLAAVGPLLAATAGLFASFAVSIRVMDHFVASFASVVEQLIRGRPAPAERPIEQGVRPSIVILGERLAAQRIALQDLSPRHREGRRV